MNKIHILLVDDDKYFRLAIKQLLEDEAIFTEAENETQALEFIKSNYFDLALVDMDIDGPKSGIRILAETRKRKTHSIILSSQNDEETIEQAYEMGCDHFLSKLHYKDYLPPYVYKYKNELFGRSTTDFFKTKFITQDKDLQNKIKEVSQINLKNKTVLITGETGVGKSLIGELLHGQSYDADAPFVHINCSEISENLMESELFGHKKGAFTGAISDKIGKLEQAHGGTLFLDEVATMPLGMQQKLLKAIDQKSFYPVGSDKEVKAEFTLITATCEDLFEKIHQNEFRKDLFFRISGINLEIKPLRARKDDIELLINHFLSQSPRRVIIKAQAKQMLINMPWPGNTREIKKMVNYLSSKSKGIIDSEDLPRSNNASEIYTEYLTNEQKSYISQNGLREFIRKIEEESLKQTLEKHQGKITHAIKELGISSSAFYRIFEKIKITT